MIGLDHVIQVQREERYLLLGRILDFRDFRLHFFEKFHEVLLLVKYSQLIKLNVFFLCLQSQQKHFLHQVVNHVKSTLQLWQSFGQYIVNLVGQIRN